MPLRQFAFALAALSLGAISSSAWQLSRMGSLEPSRPPTRPTAQRTTTSSNAGGAVVVDDDGVAALYRSSWDRRAWLASVVGAGIGSAAWGASATIAPTQPAHALVKGVAPPPPKKSSSNQDGEASPRRRCTNIDECQAEAERRAREEQEAASQARAAVSKTPGGTRYLDLDDGPGSGAVVVRDGDEVQILYKVLKLGKRSYDGLSGEGTVVFSRGYGLEDDESGPGQQSFTTTVGSVSNIAALNDALVGMKVGGIRRFAVLPQMGWRKPGKSCDGGPGGSGTGGDVKTDYVVVPTAQLVAEEACFDTTKQPFPSTYAQRRRMAQRFDQSLIMEVQVVSASQPTETSSDL